MFFEHLPILAAAVVAYAVGAVWHSPIGFGTYWMKLMGFSREDMRTMPLTPVQAMSIGFVVTVLVAYVLSFFIAMTYAFTLSAVLELGFWVWLGFLVPTLANGWLWEGKSLKLFAFNALYALVNIEIMALVLGVWQ
jgi:uncharacterized protein YacL